MLQDVVYPPEQLQIEKGMSSPIAAHKFDFCDPNLFPENLQNSNVSSCSRCCNDETSYTNDLSLSSFPSKIASFNHPTTGPAAASNNLTLLRDLQTENKSDVSASINFPSSMPMSPQNQVSSAFSALSNMSTHNNHFGTTLMQFPLLAVEVSGFSHHHSSDSIVPVGRGPSLEALFEGDALSSMPPSYVRMGPASPSSSFLDRSSRTGDYLLSSMNGVFHGNVIADSGLTSQELEFPGENCGVYCSGEVQVINESQQQMMKGKGGFAKAPRLTLEERKVKIHRYIKKRNERNFRKKIKYACRKTLADSRPRVRGRLAKNDEVGQLQQP